jgi:hypothetical protein
MGLDVHQRSQRGCRLDIDSPCPLNSGPARRPNPEPEGDKQMSIRPVVRWRAAMSSLVFTAVLVAVPVARGTEMIVTSEVPTSHWKTKYLNAFAEDVKQRTNGALTV